MRLFTLFCVLCEIALACSIEDPVFKKCCSKYESLTKISYENKSEQFKCVKSASAVKSDVKRYSSLLISDTIAVNYGFPESCENLQLHYVTEDELKLVPSELCYDMLLSEISNDTERALLPRAVQLTCKQNKTENEIISKVKIHRFRKCCPNGQGYDAENHFCRDTEQNYDVNWLLSKLDVRDPHYIYNVEEGLHCKSDQYAVELIEGNFTLDLDRSILNVLGRSGGGRVLSGDWCVDTNYAGPRLVARICTADCAQYGAYCLRKCCPVGHHFQPYRCGSMRSKCVPNEDDKILFNLSSYLDPFRAEYAGLSDVLGIQEGLKCDLGRFVLNNSVERDRNWLTKEGLGSDIGLNPKEYCLEAFDFSACEDQSEIVIFPMACFVAEVEKKNFMMAAVTNTISAVCLLITLVVYCCLPELRNLHGRTLTCHVSTMLLAYSCLARPQFSTVEDHQLCVLLGYGIYFGFVGAFFWLNIMCFDIWWTFVTVRTVQPLRKAGMDRRRFIWYSLYAWGCTLFFTLIMYLCDVNQTGELFDPNIGKNMCWFGSVQNTDTDWPHYIFFVIPMGLVTSVNVVLWVLTARHCARVKSEMHRLQAGSTSDRAKKRFQVDRAKYIITGKLWVVMGAGWFSELLSTIFHEPPWLWAGVDLINQLQGLFIFLILVFKPKVFRLLRKRLGLERPDAQKNGTSSSARTTSTVLSRTISSDERTHLRTSAHSNDTKRT